MILILYRLSSESKNDIAALKELITSLEAKVNEMPSVATSLPPHDRSPAHVQMDLLDPEW